MGFWGVVLNAIKNADVVLLVADARLPSLSLSGEIVRKAKSRGAKVFFVCNKVDLLSPSFLEKLRREYEGAFFVSVKKRTGISSLKKSLQRVADSFSRSSLRVAILGYPNAGKSSLLNLLAPRAKAKVSSVSGTTKETQWIRVGSIRFMDVPGVIPNRDKSSVAVLLSAKNPHKLRNPEKTVDALIKFLLKNNPGTLQKAYGVTETSSYETFSLIGKKKGFLLKGGELDEHRTAITILDDWQKGKILLV